MKRARRIFPYDLVLGRTALLIIGVVSITCSQALAQDGTWTTLAPIGGPPPGRNEHSAVYDTNTDTMVVFGGRTGSSGGFNDTWLLTSADGLGGTSTWAPLITSGGPPAARIEHSAVYDPSTNQMIIFGGSFSGASCGQSFNDTWSLSNANGSGGPAIWTQLAPVGPLPPPRAGHTAVYNPSTNRMIVFGGSAPCGDFSDVWVLENANGIGGQPMWTQLFPTGGPPAARYGHSAVYDVATNRMIVYAGSSGINDIWVLTSADGTGGTPSWILLAPSGAPPQRFDHSAVYDPSTNRMTIFGGLINALNPTVNDVWVLSNANGVGGTPSWTQLSPSGTLPATRYVHTATYNSTTNRMTVFGGVEDCYATCVAGNDTWVLSAATGAPPNSPPTANAGSDQTVEATSAAGAIVTLSGAASTDPDGDTLTFAWSGPFGTLSGVTVSPTLPLGTSTVTLTADDGHGNTATATVHVNVVDTTPPTLSLPGNITAETTGPSGAPVSYSATATDLVDGSVAVNCTPASGSTFALGTTTVHCSATDAHSNTATGSFTVTVGTATVSAPNWTQLSLTGGLPPARLLHTAVYDPGTNAMIVFGGLNHTGGAGGPCVGTTCYDDVWVLSNADGLGGTPVWNQLTPSGTAPLPRFSPTAVYDQGSNSMIVFGGGSDASPPYFGGCTGQFNDTWVLSNANGSGGTPTWTQLNTAGGPGIPRQAHSAVYDPNSNRMTIFGGGGDCGFLADLWVLSNANGAAGPPTWTQLSPAGPAPSNRAQFAAVSDTGNTRMIIFGGAGCPTVVPPGENQCSQVLFNDVWVLSNADGLGGVSTWTQLAPTGGPPSPRAGLSAVYNPATNTMTVFGGSDAGGNLLSDIWQLSNANGLGGTPAWTQLTPTGGPSARASHIATFHLATNRMTIFGGSQTSTPTLGAIGLNDTWVLSNANGVASNSPPTANAGSDQTVEATSAAGAIVTLSGAASTDPDGDTLTFAWSGPFGTLSGVTISPTLPLGTSTVTLTVDDGHGNTATATVHINVVDTTPPTLSLPANITAEATGPTGAVVSYSATATDLVDGPVAVICTPASGATFAMSTTTVHCSAADAHGNTATGSFTVTVRDTTPPVLSLPANIMVEATGPTGAVVSYSATATDLVDGSVAVICTPASGSTFALGTTTVHCSATDAHSNAATGSFAVTVRDTTPPTLLLPGNLAVNASNPAGANVNYSVSATDLVDPNPSASCVPASGAAFPNGTTTVNCTATDFSGNASHGSFTVTVYGATAQINNLITLVNSVLAVNSQQGIDNSLDAKLQNALAAIDSLKANSIPTAINQLNAFINEVQAQSGKAITADQANQLIAAANQIKLALGG